jgi:hypothetical protein
MPIKVFYTIKKDILATNILSAILFLEWTEIHDFVHSDFLLFPSYKPILKIFHVLGTIDENQI